MIRALGRSRTNAGQQASSQLGDCSALASPRLLILATNSVPARAPALRFWVRHLRKSGCRH
nr:putative integron gene cassette protein [uncultured bacterium]